MSVGTGIFLGAVVLAIVYLYKITRDRWKWPNLARRGMVALGLALVVVALGVVSVLIYEKIENMPRKQTGYADLLLGMTMDEVKYVKGIPTNVLGKPDPFGDRLMIPTNELKKWGTGGKLHTLGLRRRKSFLYSGQIRAN
jgi:hypothetical protein